MNACNRYTANCCHTKSKRTLLMSREMSDLWCVCVRRCATCGSMHHQYIPRTCLQYLLGNRQPLYDTRNICIQYLLGNNKPFTTLVEGSDAAHTWVHLSHHSVTTQPQRGCTCGRECASGKINSKIKQTSISATTAIQLKMTFEGSGGVAWYRPSDCSLPRSSCHGPRHRDRPTDWVRTSNPNPSIK